jgi:polar amino acid transport system substrate-binding protein
LTSVPPRHGCFAIRVRMLAMLFALITTACADPPVAPSGVVAELAPGGTLRAAINLGNPILAKTDDRTSAPVGVSVDLARALADRLHARLQLVTYPSAGQVVAAATKGEWDIAFVARDPKRAETLLQTSPYLAIEGAYLVRQDSPIVDVEQVDSDGVRIAVGAGSAYDLYLSRTLRHAQLRRVPTSPAVTETFLQEHLEAAAGVRQQLEADADRLTGVRVLPGHFMQIEQAMATTEGRNVGAAYLETFLQQMKQSDFIGRSLRRHQIDGVVLTP